MMAEQLLTPLEVDDYVCRAPDLKTVIVDCALAGLITQQEAEDLIAWYGLRHE